MDRDRRAELERWIAESEALQKKLAMIYGSLAVVVLGLFVWRRDVGELGFVLLALVAICSFWVTSAHIVSHREKLDELDAADRKREEPPPAATGHRKWAPRERD